MQIHNLSKQNSILNQFLAEIRDPNIQTDQMKFRTNMNRIGNIIAYEISKELSYNETIVQTPLGTKRTNLIQNKIVLCSILRAGLSLHNGFMDFFDKAENGFISAFRNHYNGDDKFEIVTQYQATPDLKDKTLILIDPMLATGQSLVAVLYKLVIQKPKEIHIAVTIAAPEGVKYLYDHLPENCHLWICSLDEKLDEKNYIIPGLGDAGDLAFGQKI
jgi:uracil phosphoribosyltransferase